MNEKQPVNSDSVNGTEGSLNSFLDESDSGDDCYNQPSSSNGLSDKSGWFEGRMKRASTLLQSSKYNIKDKLWATWNTMKYSGKWMSDKSGSYDQQGQIIILSKFYAPEGSDGLPGAGFSDFVKDYYSKIWITYRTGIPPFVGTNLTTDCGWGCMIRTTQMMIAQAIILKTNGRNWRSLGRKNSLHSKVDDTFIPHQEYLLEINILGLFEDSYDAPLGIHKLLSYQQDIRGKSAYGRWYSPSEAISMMRMAIRESTSPFTSDLSLMLSVTGRISVSECSRISHDWTKKLLLFITLRLGTSTVNKVYYNHLRQLFSVSTCLGLLGGRPEHSLYFLGFYGDHIIYLDPHVAHEYAPLSPAEPQQRSNYNSYHCKLLSRMPFSDMDPSFAVGFLFSSQNEFDDTIRQLNLNQVIDIDLGPDDGTKRTRDPIFSVFYGEEPPAVTVNYDLSEEDVNVARQHGFEML